MNIGIVYEWHGDLFRPVNSHWAKLCDEQFVIGKRYVLEEAYERSPSSHRHYFAAVREAWLNLPEDVSEQFPSPTHLRRYALIKAGYGNVSVIVVSSADDAVRVAAFMEEANAFDIITVKDCTISRFTAKSQSYKAMGKKEFQESKTAVLDIVAAMVGVTTDELRANAEAAS